MDPSNELITSKILRFHKSGFSYAPLLPFLLSDPNLYTPSLDQLELKGDNSCFSDWCKFVSKSTCDKRNSSSSRDIARDDSEISRGFSDTKEHSSLRRLLTAHWCPKSITGARLLNEEQTNFSLYPFNIQALDDLLGGGLKTSEITEIIGKFATGKTQVCLKLCASVLSRYPCATILYLDTKGDFLPGRLKSYLENDFNTINIRNYSSVNLERSAYIKECLQRIRICLVPTITHLLDALTTVRMSISKQNAHRNSSETNCLSDFFSHCRIIIIDSLAMPYLLFMATLPQLAISELALVTVELQRLAILEHCAVLVINHSRIHMNSTKVPLTDKSSYHNSVGCLGYGWASIPHSRIVFEHINPVTNLLNIKATLIKNNHISNSCSSQQNDLKFCTFSL